MAKMRHRSPGEKATPQAALLLAVETVTSSAVPPGVHLTIVSTANVTAIGSSEVSLPGTDGAMATVATTPSKARSARARYSSGAPMAQSQA